MVLFLRQIIRLHWSDSLTMGVSDYSVTLCFSCFLVALVQLIVAVFWTLQIYSISTFSLRLIISAVDWTHLCGEFEVLEMGWFGYHPWNLKIL